MKMDEERLFELEDRFKELSDFSGRTYVAYYYNFSFVQDQRSYVYLEIFQQFMD